MKTVVGTFAALALGAPMLASAAEGWVVADISLQAGPDTRYPSIMELDGGTPVSIQGCLEGWTWCDVIVGPERGWVPGTFLEEAYGGRRVVVIDYGPRIGIPVVGFALGFYWDHYYRNRPFYAQRQEWVSRSIVPHAPPRPSGAVAGHSTESRSSTAATTLQTRQRAPAMTTATAPATRATGTQQTPSTQTAATDSERRTGPVTNERREPVSGHAPVPQPESQQSAQASGANQLKQPAEPPRTRPAQRTAMQQQEKPKGQPRSDEPKTKDELKAPKKREDRKKDEGGGGGDDGGGRLNTTHAK